MDRIAIVGLSIHGSDVAGLAGLRRPPPDGEVAFLRELADELGASELVYLATCNRTEVIFAREEGEAPGRDDVAAIARVLGTPCATSRDLSEPRGRRAAPLAAMPRAARTPGELPGAPLPPGAPPAPDTPPAPGPARLAPAHDWRALAGRLQLRTGRDAVHHLFRVAGSLDSLVVGEDQILAQVRQAYGRAADIGLVGPLLGPLFHHALAVGKQVRSETGLARHPVSVVNLAVAALVEHSCHAAAARDGALAIAVIGAGEMGALLVRALAAAGMAPALVVNRTPAAAERLAADCGARALSLDAFRAGRYAIDALVSVTSAPGAVLSVDELSALAARTPAGGPLLGVDLAVPRDLPDVSGDERVRVVCLDDLRAVAERHKALRAEAAAAAERLVERKVAVFARRFHEDVAAPLVTELRQGCDELLQRELAGLLGGRLAHLPEDDRRAVERWARATFGRLMHLPTAALKRLAAQMRADGAADGEVGGGDDVPAGGAARAGHPSPEGRP